jgi:pentachlorophenol monooxygenase
VRRRIDITADPTGPEQSVGALEQQTGLGLGRSAHVVVDGARTSVLWPLPGGRCRWTLEVGSDLFPRDASPATSLRLIADLVGTRASWFPESGAAADWAGLLQFAPARATPFGRGRVWLVGDAAQVRGSIGVPDLDEALYDAHDLASRLARAVGGEDGRELLEGYNHERRATAEPSASLLSYLMSRDERVPLEAR